MNELPVIGSKPKQIKAKPPPDPKFILKTEMGYIHCINFSLADSNNFVTLYAGSENGELSLWNLTTKKLCIKQKLESPILTLLFHNSTIISQEKGGCIKIHQLHENVLNLICSTVVANTGFCKCILMDNVLVVPAEEGIDLYNIDSMKISKSFNYDKDKKYGMIMCLTKVKTSVGLYVLAIYETGDGVLCDMNSFSMSGTIKFRAEPIAATFDDNKERGIVVGRSGIIQIFRGQSPCSGGMNIIYEIEVPNAILTSVKSRPDGLVFVIGGSDGKLRYFSWKSLKLLVVLIEHKKSITDIQFIPSGITASNKSIMVASSGDGAISLWDIY